MILNLRSSCKLMSSWGDDHIQFGNWKNKVQATSMPLLSTNFMVSMNENVKEWDSVLMFRNECTNVMWLTSFPTFLLFQNLWIDVNWDHFRKMLATSPNLNIYMFKKMYFNNS
jgi:hypothetical protein